MATPSPSPAAAKIFISYKRDVEPVRGELLKLMALLGFDSMP
jgi:hypothetical protein